MIFAKDFLKPIIDPCACVVGKRFTCSMIAPMLPMLGIQWVGDPVSGTLDPTPAEAQSAAVKWQNLIWLRTMVRQSKVCYRTTSLCEQISFKYNR